MLQWKNLPSRGKPIIAALALGASATVGAGAFLVSQVEVPRIEHLPSVREMLQWRSPGPRTAAHLIKDKAPRSEAGAQEPVERALGKMFEPEVEPVLVGEGPFASPEALLVSPDVAPLGDLALPSGDLSSDGPRGSIGFPQIVGGGGGGGGGGGSPGGAGPGGGSPGTGGPGSTPPVDVTPAVPEPGTWALMLLGMGLCGFTMRRRRFGIGTRRLCEGA